MQDFNPFGPPPQNQPIDRGPSTNDNNKQDGYVEIIDRRQLVPINDTACKHEKYIRDDSDETDEWVSWVCSNSKCPVGYLESK